MLLITVGYVTITELKEGAMHDCEGVCYYQDQVVGLEGKTLVTSEVVASIYVSICLCDGLDSYDVAVAFRFLELGMRKES